MAKKNKMKRLRVVNTKRNKWLEPMYAGRCVIGYNEEIHVDDATVFTYKLPLGAIKRLVRSYYEDIQGYDEENIYFRQSSSSGLRGRPYCYRMLDDIGKQLIKHKLNNKKIIQGVFDRYFKDSYTKLNRYSKNHQDQAVYYNFKPCSDPKCCNYTDSISFKLKILKELLIETIKKMYSTFISSSLPVNTKVEVRLHSKD